MKKTAILLTVFNRKAKTLSCIGDIHALIGWDPEAFDIYVVDGGSSDGTPEAISAEYPDVILKTCAGLFWAGGMREAWKTAADSGNEYSRYILVNDDVRLYPDAVQKLEEAEATYPGGIYVGAMKDPETGVCTYGGQRLLRKGHEKCSICPPDGSIQLIDLGNANLMMVSKAVYDKIGGLCEVYTHGIADYDYTLTAQEAGFPVVLARDYCGECANDNGDSWKSQASSLKERIDYLYSPKGLAFKEYMYYVQKFFPKDDFRLRCHLYLKTLFPKLWDLKKMFEKRA